MKLFQIEEPDGSPLDAEGDGAAVGIEMTDGDGAVAIALGGNAELLPGADGERRMAIAGLRMADGRLDEIAVTALLQGLRGWAEKQLTRPVTQAVIATAPADDAARAVVARAAQAAGLDLLRLVDPATAASAAPGATPAEAVVLGAAMLAEDAAAPLD